MIGCTGVNVSFIAKFTFPEETSWLDIHNPHDQDCRTNDLDECTLGLWEYTSGARLDATYMDELDVKGDLCVKVNTSVF